MFKRHQFTDVLIKTRGELQSPVQNTYKISLKPKNTKIPAQSQPRTLKQKCKNYNKLSHFKITLQSPPSKHKQQKSSNPQPYITPKRKDYPECTYVYMKVLQNGGKINMTICQTHHFPLFVPYVVFLVYLDHLYTVLK